MRNNYSSVEIEDRAALLMAFAETARRLSFAEAADKLGLTRSTLSRRVQKLEDQIGVQLLNRTTRVVSLTEAGRVYYQYALKIIDAMSEADAAAASFGGRPSGRLVLSVPSTFGRKVIAPLMAGFMQSYTDVRIDLRLSDDFVDLIDNGIDAAVRIGDMKDSTLVARRVGTIIRRLVASPAYLERKGYPQTPREVSQHQCLNFTHLAAGERWTLHKGKEISTVTITPWFRSNDADVLFQATCAGEGIALLADFITREQLQTGELVDVFPDWSLPETSVQIVYPSTGYLPEKTRVFVDYIVGHLPSTLTRRSSLGKN